MDVAESTGVEVGPRRLTGLVSSAQRMAQQPDLAATLRAVLDEACSLRLGDAVGVLLVDHRNITAAGATEPEADQAGVLQLHGGEGPGVETLLTGQSLRVDDLAAESRWPGWAPRALRLGWLSLLSVPLVDGDTFGAVTCYARRAGAVDETHLRLAEVFAVHASLALARARERHALERALEGRTWIGQAQGILMERYDFDAEQAFSVLRRYSSHGNRKLRDVAEEIARTRHLPEFAGPDPTD